LQFFDFNYKTLTGMLNQIVWALAAQKWFVLPTKLLRRE